MASLPSGSQFGHSHAGGLGRTSLNLARGLSVVSWVRDWDDVVGMGDSPVARVLCHPIGEAGNGSECPR
jgi:hypothetical protein